MAGMRALGRVYNVVPLASGVPLNLDNCSGVGLLASTSSTASTSLAFTAAKTFGGSYANVTPANGFGQPGTWYSQTAAGTSAWVANTSVWTTNSLAVAGTLNNISYVDYLVSELADGYPYLKVTATNCALTAILYDLTVQRTPANLQIVSQ